MNDNEMLGEFKWGGILYKPAHMRDRPRLNAKTHSFTPPEFREVLLELARDASRQEVAA